ncbi:hypothetical protein BU24DRAFT_253858 [Aaosphaeria arxii CBS 175.79]|uniref:Uncharacterized protein n=1 Tax=Aaosphaeria arxii CBS 175.79 TaxID=1450172 RepID=A0A6A5XI39_9PLEO|nr:uncharacterized protein BU24DRAFT_253858 [Aaosphaeria arxii CBS 175.79]KAF2012536.1 hypothetical protein BU24DRAFT_253858 [Aaosphaeria arxii CBS 175.79]
MVDWVDGCGLVEDGWRVMSGWEMKRRIITKKAADVRVGSGRVAEWQNSGGEERRLPDETQEEDGRVMALNKTQSTEERRERGWTSLLSVRSTCLLVLLAGGQAGWLAGWLAGWMANSSSQTVVLCYNCDNSTTSPSSFLYCIRNPYIHDARTRRVTGLVYLLTIKRRERLNKRRPPFVVGRRS